MRANTPNEKVRELQRRLWTCAKRSKTRRFHALYDRVFRRDVLEEAWRRVRSNRGAAGADEESIRDIEERGVEQFLSETQEALRGGTYRPQPVRRRYIPKADGRTGNADRQFVALDDYVRERLNRWQWRRGGQRRRFRHSDWPHARYYGLGLHALHGTVKYPAQATPVKPSLSRVREIRMHGLKGESGNGRA